MELSKEDFEEWKEYPQTKAFFEVVKSERDFALQVLVKSVDIDSLTQSRLIGIMSGLQKVLELEYDDGKPE